MINEQTFAKRSIRAYQIYAFLAEREAVPALKVILTDFAHTSREQFDFWARKSGVRADMAVVPRVELLGFRLMRLALGLTLTVKFLVGRKEHSVREYKQYCRTCTVEEDGRAIDAFVDRLHSITDGIDDLRAFFFSNVMLGFNDGLISLTGALVGFSVALGDTHVVFVAGLVTGLSASLSMTASSYLQAKHQQGGGSPFYAAFFTGISYLVIVVLLTCPFVIFSTVRSALACMALIIIVLIFLVSFCSAVLLEKTYAEQFLEMACFSLGVATLAFLLGQGLGMLLHTSV